MCLKRTNIWTKYNICLINEDLISKTEYIQIKKEKYSSTKKHKYATKIQIYEEKKLQDKKL